MQSSSIYLLKQNPVLVIAQVDTCLNDLNELPKHVTLNGSSYLIFALIALSNNKEKFSFCKIRNSGKLFTDSKMPPAIIFKYVFYKIIDYHPLKYKKLLNQISNEI